MFRRFKTIPAYDRQTDGRTDGRTDGQTDGIAVASTALAMRALRRAVKKIAWLFLTFYDSQCSSVQFGLVM